ncbi:MAG: ribonuclease H-like YkuK family protein [Sulfurihydrogenibium azorense]|uniref:ribonuclease H-like YkuK family protein n=1 Tax=Sulfurihydrogenibium azorense TaxID=309806 RepID=UPI0039199FA0
MKKFNFDEVKRYIRNTSQETSIYVGCDSKQFQTYTLFVTVIVVHIDSCRGAKIFSEVQKTRRIESLRERLLKEVDLSVYAALNILDVIENRRLEIHLDINPSEKHKSNMVVKEAISYVIAQGLKPVLKPNSIAAFSVANYMVNHC